MQPGDDASNEERRPLSTDDLAATRADSDGDRLEQDDRDYDPGRADYAQGHGSGQAQTLPAQDADLLPTGERFGDDRAAPAEPTRTQPELADDQRRTERTEHPEEPTPALLPPGDADKFQLRWHELQGVFVDDPPEAVRAADQLVAEVMQAVAASFGEHKHELERQWQRGENVSTEDLRLALRQYRSFFTRLLST